MQVLQHNRLVLADELSAEFVQEVETLGPHFLLGIGQQETGLAPVMGTLHLPA